MLASFLELLDDAASRGTAVGAFTCYDSTQAAGVLDAAEDAGTGVVLLVSPASFRARRGADLLTALVAQAAGAETAVCVQLDHVSDRATVEAAFAAGAGAVMVDGSHLPLAENVALTAACVEAGARRGAHVEGELGGIAGDEDVATAISAGALTDPRQAADFVRDARPACLAVSIGNVHGHYREPPRLDVDRLAAIRAATGAHVSLHGASGLPSAELAAALAAGARKVNVNTELRTRYLATLDHGLAGWSGGANLGALTGAVRDATALAVRETLAVLGGAIGTSLDSAV
ncbi:MAG TPA: class II fructose-bisphosphate aldolase [Baekduia sp.]|uniref:class II fructose-bisphosphate aldolase n=1 Tax=Baekduia sp. TaxID=2600305 RepID=UPI002D7797C6|nr:class II fructose-bisphosphate aldolase [Baekduia sp.]HET6507867.1 class II fructose-bisphosphate aldolase [Baekduia sp.]